MMEVRALAKAFSGVKAIDEFSLQVHADEYLTLLGPSGSGKSTLLRLLAGLEKPDSGSIWLNGVDITTQPTHMRNLGFVQQKYALFPHLNVIDNVAFGLRHRELDPVTDPARVEKRVADILELVGLTDLGGRMVGQLSGGQKQRVSLARTLVTEPKVCLLDEPLGALDANLRERMTVELQKIRRALGVTFMHVTGNEAEAIAMGDRMIVLDRGRLLQVDPPDTIFTVPATIDVARYINAYNILSGTLSDGRFTSSNGAFPVVGDVPELGYYAVRYDAAHVLAPGEMVPDGSASMSARFIASEFMGSQIIYIFRRIDGGTFEVVRHLSREDPASYERDQQCTICWHAADALLFDVKGRLVMDNSMRGAA
ncbi:ABC transporter ATP-binding protein [Pseudohoeflea coraliihabitans]|uniref:ABC transporter ATP-binding protein n=1 Tax=Pseudohoeflea coraliihabitans TaxID=2860393 RepID=A0ABS6WPC8_9HYPH|nr:ABC transporter ATP-binding protein [Pseudohoeflea sp. DP4N28-3]MBW3097817.1 ABC transporter ATP-binding protein [Pseudohoeflea sp. DP4N28-3]